MARPLRIEYPGAFFHVMSRGNEGRNIFSSAGDKKKFLDYLEKTHQRFDILIHAYCLMSNHYHLLIETPCANLSKSLQYLNSSYTTYYNVKRKRFGHLFQGRFKSILIEKDSYLMELSRYIHLNPCQSKLVKFPEEFEWSSYFYYLHPKRKPKFLNTDLCLSFFANSKRRFRTFVEEGLTKNLENPFEKVKAGFVLGSEDFIEEIKEKMFSGLGQCSDPLYFSKIMKSRNQPEKLIQRLNQENFKSEKEKTKMIVYLVRKFTDQTLEEIGNLFQPRMSQWKVSKILKRMDQKRNIKIEYDKRLKKIELKVSNVQV